MRILIVSVVLACMMPAAGLLMAQSKRDKAEEAAKRSVEGVVTNATEQLVEGAIVQLKDLKSLQVRSYVTKQDGKYHFFGLSPNIDYEIKGEFQGAASKTRTLSVYDQRKKAIMDLKLEKK
jgi:hypothetical protein